jgi:DNA-binding beta-propeller fold protein YncE
VKRNLLIGGTLVVAVIALGITERALEQVAQAQAKTGQVPVFEVDPFWPKTMKENWIFGQTIGLGIDEKDQVWIIHRGNDMSLSPATKRYEGNLDGTEYARPPLTPKDADSAYYMPGNRVSECCDPAPPVVAFDMAGNIVHAWGGPSLHPDWPESNHGIVVDHKGIVWIGGNGGPDSHILKFTREGKFVGMIGRRGARVVDGKIAANSNDPENFGRVAKIFIDPKANEAYVADGYLNKRVAVVDMDSGKIKRYWGAYGNKPDDTPIGRYDPKAPLPQQFRTPVHCAELSNDGFVYVCDRPNDRLQVFTKEGKFVKEKQFFPETLSDGSVWDIAFSRDPQQRWIFMADGANEHVYVIDRNSLEVVSQFGTGGRQPGQFRGVHSIAVDSKGNIYTTETYTGKRLQRFMYRGMGAPQRGVPWPTR